MGLFITSKSQATRHGVYAMERTPAALITPTGTGTACLVEQLPWGPSQTLTTPDSRGALINTIAPAGMTRTGPGYLACIQKAFPLLKFVRVLGSTAAIATVNLPNAVPTNIVRVDLKYAGTEGNAVVITVAAATDGDANHVNITATVSGASGVTTETVNNFNASGVGAPTPLTSTDVASLKLIGGLTILTPGVPAAGSYTCTGGTNGTIAAADYVGTQGTADKGFAKLEGDKTIDHVFMGDPSSSFRATANAGLVSHVNYMGDRIGYLNGNQGLTSAQARTDVANYRHQNVVYADPWVYIYDDVTGAKTIVSSAAFAASVASQLPPSTSIAWKASTVGDMLAGIVDLESDRGDAAGLNTTAGIATFIREEEGGFRIEAGVTTIAPSTPAKKNLTRSRMGIFLARSATRSLRPSVDAPNVPINQQDVVDAITAQMEGLKANSKNANVNFLPHVLDYSIGDLGTDNLPADLAAGDFAVPINAQESSGMSRIFLIYNHGENVVIAQ